MPMCAMPMCEEKTTVRAADLGERIVDEISEADQDWRAIELCARELVELAAERAAESPRASRARMRRRAPDQRLDRLRASAVSGRRSSPQKTSPSIAIVGTPKTPIA